jgi:hypothetical protein
MPDLRDVLADNPPKLALGTIPLDDELFRRVVPAPFQMRIMHAECRDWPNRPCARRHVAHQRNSFNEMKDDGRMVIHSSVLGWWSES